MLSTVFAAEAQFRLDSESRAREHTILGSIRERSEPQSPLASPSAMRREVSWPRPIGVRLDTTSGTRRRRGLTAAAGQHHDCVGLFASPVEIWRASSSTSVSGRSMPDWSSR